MPVDSKNIYKTPKKFRGLITENGDSSEGYWLKKHSITVKEVRSHKIINGIWFNPRDTMRNLNLDTAARGKPKNWRLTLYSSLYSVKFDSLNNPIDTVENYIIKRSKIYRIGTDGLEEGSNYTIMNDTIYTSEPQKQLVIGPQAFFRKVTSNIYILNLYEGNLEGGNPDWWQILLLSKNKEGKTIIHYWDNKIMENSSLIYSKDGNYYYDSQWTREEILKLFNEGIFEPMNTRE